MNHCRKQFPLAPLKLAALEGSLDFAEKVNAHLVDYRHLNPTHEAGSIAYKGYAADTYLLKCACPRFGTGEAKGIIGESVRGTDMFIMVDVCNFSLTYTVCGHKNHMSPDDHYQDLKRIISAANRQSPPDQRHYALPLRGKAA